MLKERVVTRFAVARSDHRCVRVAPGQGGDRACPVLTRTGLEVADGEVAGHAFTLTASSRLPRLHARQVPRILRGSRSTGSGVWQHGRPWERAVVWQSTLDRPVQSEQ